MEKPGAGWAAKDGLEGGVLAFESSRIGVKSRLNQVVLRGEETGVGNSPPSQDRGRFRMEMGDDPRPLQPAFLVLKGDTRDLNRRHEGRRALPVSESWSLPQVAPFVAVSAAKRNTVPRRCLGGANASDRYAQRQRRGRWNKRQRHQAFEWIYTRAITILQNSMKVDQRSFGAAWRHAVEAGLDDQALIEVRVNNRSATPFNPPSGPINW